jgi:type I restriction enzyme S subunit
MRPEVEKALEVLATGKDFVALRRALFATVAGHHLNLESTGVDRAADSSEVRQPLEVLLAQLPTSTLSAVAFISKGLTGIKDAQPGPFPLVVTAEERSSSDHFDFEGPAVMIPMVSSTGHGDASLKRVHFQDGQYAVGSILAVVQPKDPAQLSARYLHAYLSGFKDELLVSRMVGTANVSLTVAKIGDVPVPLLPIAAQQKVDELMALCDRLEARQQDAEAAHAQLVQILLDSLTQARDADEFQASWERLAGQFPMVFTSESSIAALTAVVLELAVSGRLVEHSSAEPPAIQLLQEIAAIKAHLVDAEGLRTTARDDVPTEEHYLPLQAGWAYARIGNLARFIDYRGRTPNKTQGGVPLITAKNVRPGYVSRDPMEYIAAEEFEAWMTRGLPRVGDMLFTTEAPLGNVAVIDIEERFALAQRVICFQLHCIEMAPYLRLAFMSQPVQTRILDMATGMTATGVKASRLKELPLPIPPLGEQRRIVAKVDELLAICDQLKARIAAARAKPAQLAEALVAQAVAA